MCQADEQCIKQCLNGRPDAYRHLVSRYEKPIRSYLTRRLGDPETAGEVAQESFVRAYLRLDSLKKGDAFFPWLLGISQRVMLETFRRRRHHKPISDVPEPAANSDESSTDMDAELAEAVAGLPDIYREAIVLRYFGGLSCVEASERLGVPLGTVTKRLSRAYALLRTALSPTGGEQNQVLR